MTMLRHLFAAALLAALAGFLVAGEAGQIGKVWLDMTTAVARGLGQ